MKKRLLHIVLSAALGVMIAVPFALGAEKKTENVVPGKGYTAPKAVKQVRPARVYYMNNREVLGFVTVAMLVDEKGEVEQVRILYRTSTFAVNNAVIAASKWTFEPATLNGHPVKAWVAYNLPFGPTLEAFEDSDFVQKIVQDNIVYTLK